MYYTQHIIDSEIKFSTSFKFFKMFPYISQLLFIWSQNEVQADASDPLLESLIGLSHCLWKAWTFSFPLNCISTWKRVSLPRG